MDGQGVFTGFDEREWELLNWATEWDDGDDAVYADTKATDKIGWVEQNSIADEDIHGWS